MTDDADQKAESVTVALADLHRDPAAVLRMVEEHGPVDVVDEHGKVKLTISSPIVTLDGE